MLGSSLILNCDPPSESKKRSSSLIQTFSVTQKSYAEPSRNTLEERIVYKYTSPVVRPYEMEQLAATKVMLGQKTLSQLSILRNLKKRNSIFTNRSSDEINPKNDKSIFQLTFDLLTRPLPPG